MLVLLLACAPSETAGRDFAEGRAGRVSLTNTLTVDVDGDAGASVHLVQIQGSGGSFTRYSTLSTASVSSGSARVSLGSSVGATYLSDGGGNSAIFAVLLLDEDGAVVGIGDDTVGFYSTAPSGTRSTGWLVGVDGLHSAPTRYSSLSSGIDVEAALDGDDELTLRGSATTLPLASSPRIQAAPVDDSAGSPWDAPIATRWTATLSGTPDELSTRSVDGHIAAYFPLEVYDDTNGNEDWDGAQEPVIGAVCHGSADVVVRWIGREVEDLDALYAMLEDGIQYGWMVGKLSGYAFTEITDASSLRVRDAC